jgi:hypothetical protein
MDGYIDAIVMVCTVLHVYLRQSMYLLSDRAIGTYECELLFEVKERHGGASTRCR